MSVFAKNSKKKKTEDIGLPPVLHFGDNIIFCSKVRGFSHIRDNKPCQDAFLTHTIKIGREKLLILAVADGHGSSKHDLSEYGSRLAVESAIFVVKSMHRKYGFNIHNLYLAMKSDFPGEVMREWRQRVVYDMKTRKIPFDSENLKDALVRYGTTLLFAVVYKDTVVFGKLGDGNIVIADDNNGAIEPIEEDTTLVGGATYSMSHQTKAISKWSVKFYKGFNMLSLSTDGFCNSFENDEDFYNAIFKISDYYKANDEQKTNEMLPDFLNYCSTNGSGDDITFVFLTKDKSKED